MKIIHTKQPEWLQKWDDFVKQEDKASHLMLSGWLASYRSYGFDFECCICTDNEKVIGGYGAIIAKVFAFKFYIVPFGPIVNSGNQTLLDQIIISVRDRGKAHKACYAQIALPISSVALNTHVFDVLPELPSLKNAVSGHLFPYVYSSGGLNWVALKDYPDAETLLQSFKSSVRRDIRNAVRKELTVKVMQGEGELESAYNLCLDNAEKNQYALRSWIDFKETLLKLCENNDAKFLAVLKEGDLKGAILLVKAGNYYTYILGGTKKEKPDLLAGHLLQWEAIKLSFEEGLDGYNISLGGSQGVVGFKNSFNTVQVLFENSKFHWVLRPGLFRIYVAFEKHLKPHKKFLSKILSRLRK